jgi:hypothetical protein
MMDMPLQKHIAVVGIALSACAQKADVGNMVLGKTAVQAAGSPLASALCIGAVTGGEATNPMWVSKVDNEGFRGALDGSLRNNGLLASDPKNCRYDVNANLLGLSQPIAGISMTVTSNVNYSVLERASGDPYFQTTVKKPYTAEFGTAFLGVRRLQIANEGSIRTNIGVFIDQLLSHKPETKPAGQSVKGKPTS